MTEETMNEVDLIFELDRLIVEGKIAEDAADAALDADDVDALRELVESARKAEREGWVEIAEDGGRLTLA